MLIKNHPIITAIEENEKLDGEMKLLALAEIDILSRNPEAGKKANLDLRDTATLSSAFVWDWTELGDDFYRKIYKVIYGSKW